MTYNELVNLSIAYADRYDIEVKDNIPSFIIMTEARINRLLKTRKQSARATTVAIDGLEYYGLPPDWAGMRDINANVFQSSGSSKSEPMHLLDPTTFENTIIKDRVYQTKGNIYTVIADQIRIHPTLSDGSSIEMVYYQKVPPLTLENQSNWLSNDNPDIYLAGMTAEISLFAKDYDAATGWYDRLKVAVGELDNVDWQERWSGDSLQIRLG